MATIHCILCGAEAEVEVSGRYLPATLYDPPEYPEVGYDPSCECQDHPAVKEMVYIEMMLDAANEAVRDEATAAREDW